MVAERIHPNHQKLYQYHKGQSYISYRTIGEGCTHALQFIRFECPEEAEEYFMRELLGSPEWVATGSAEATTEESLETIAGIKRATAASTEKAIQIALNLGLIKKPFSKTTVDRALKKRGFNRRYNQSEKEVCTC
jgi:hypothetical protein